MFALSQVRCFVAVAEELHFGRAAARLNITQPPLSRQIRILERRVGARLFNRTSRTVQLTYAGAAFLPEATRILRLVDEAAATARRVAAGVSGTLSIGFTAAIGYGLLPDLVGRLRDRMPGITLVLKELVSSTQIEALSAGDLDVGLLRPHRQHPGLDTLVLHRESLLVALPAREAESWPAKPTPVALDGKPFLMYSPYEARYFHQLVESCLERHSVIPQVVEYVAQIHTMLALVSSGIGIALVPAAAARLGFQGISLRPIKTDPKLPVEVVSTYRADSQNPALALFKQNVLAEYARRL